MLLLLVFACVFWLIAGIDLICGVLFHIPILNARNAPTLTTFPQISILFSARDEQKHIGSALRSFLGLDYPNYEVIAVNDRSTDGTLSVMRSLQDSRLKIIDIKELPEGWIGKNHALQKAYEASSGEWLVFTDADVIFDNPQTLRVVTAFAQSGGYAHAALLPRMILKGQLEKIFTTAFGLGFYFYFRPWAAPDAKSKSYIGVGAFNFIRRNAYEKLGTHSAFPMNVLDDMELARRVKAAGFRQTGIFGHELISVPWVEGWSGILKSLEKNGFAGFGYNLWFLLALTCLSFLLNVLPFWIFLFGSGAERLLSGVALAAIFFVYLALQRHHKHTWTVFFFHPAGCLLVLFMVWRSTLLALKNGGVCWRDTFYPLNQLKQK